MAISSGLVSVAVTATVLHSGDGDGDAVNVINNGAAVVFVGGSGVTTAAGFPVAAGASLSLEVPAGKSVYGIVSAGTVECRVLVVNR